MRRGSSQQGAPATPSDRLAAAWDGDRDALAVVTTPIAAPLTEPVTARAKSNTETATADTEPDTVVEPPRAPASFRPALTLLAGCLIGASLTGLVFLASGADRRPQSSLANTGALSAAASEEPGLAAAPQADAAQPSAPVVRADVASRGDSVAPPRSAQPAAVASATAEVARASTGGPLSRTDIPPSGDDSSPADLAATPFPARTPASALARQLAVPDLVNAPQVLFPTDILPEAPALIERVVILAPRSVSRTGREEAAALLREAGWPARDPATSPFTISRTQVRYYHESDRAGAEELAALFSAEARDFTSYSPRPDEGMIELWLAGRAPSRQPQQQGPSLARFLGRLAAALELRD